MADEPTQTPATETPAPATTPPAPSANGENSGPASQPEGSQPSAQRERGSDGKFKPADKPVDGEPPPQAAADPYAALAVPDGLEVDADVLDDAKRIFAELKIPPERAQELVNLQARVERESQARFVRQQQALTEQTKNDPEYGGVLQWPATESKLAAIRSHVGAKFIDALNAQGLGNHPEVIRGLLKLHDAAGLSEDRLISGSKAPSAGMAAMLYPNTPQMRD